MYKKILLPTVILFCATMMSAQTIEELTEKKTEIEAQLVEKRGEVGALEGELATIQKQIDVLSGWKAGFSGLIGFDFGGTNKWISSPNPTSSSSALGIGVTAYANNEGNKHFWRNKLIVNKAWQDIDIIEGEDDKLFDQGTTDQLNLSSLGGYKLNDKLALSALGEMNTSLSNFLQPGTVDIGVGGTWTPISNLVVVFHPLNYHVAWSADGDASAEGAIGTKIRADYQDEFSLAGRKISWSSTFTTFVPYSDTKTMVIDVNKFGAPLTDANGNNLEREAGLFEYTWLNTFSFQIWKGIGAGVTFGLRNAEFEFQDLQSFYKIGLSYTL